MATLSDIVNDGEGNRASRDFGVALIEIAEMATDTRLEEAQLFLRARTLAQEALDAYEIEHANYTAKGQNRL